MAIVKVSMVRCDVRGLLGGYGRLFIVLPGSLSRAPRNAAFPTRNAPES